MASSTGVDGTESAPPAAAAVSPGRAWAALVALAVPLFALSADLNGVAVLLPDLGGDLGVSRLTASAVVTAAALGFAAPLLLVGRLTDRFGARMLLLGGVALFAGSSAICAAAEGFAVLMAGRALQGVASAACFTTALVTIDALFDATRRPVAIGIWAAIGGVGGALGPLLASGLASVWSWRAFFTVNIGLGALACGALAVLVPARPGQPDRAVHGLRLAALAVGVALTMGGLQNAADGGGGEATTWAAMLLGGAVTAGAARARGADPLVTRTVARLRSYRAGVGVATVSNWGSGVALVLVPSALAAARGLDVLDTGLVFLGFSVAFALGSAVSGSLVGHHGAVATMVGGALAQAGGLVLLAAVGLDASLPLVLVALAISGAGNGLVYSAATTAALADVDAGDAGEASGLLTMLRLLGLAVGVAVSGALVAGVDAEVGIASADGMRVALVVGAVVTAIGALLAPGRLVGPRGAGATR